MSERRVQLYPGQSNRGIKITAESGKVELWYYHDRGGNQIGNVEPCVARRLADAINEAAGEAEGK